MKRDNRLWLRLIALLAVALLTLAACGEDEEPNTEPGGGDDTEETSDGADFTLIKEGTLTVGSDIPYPPFEFQEDDGTLSGYDVELVREIATRLGLENTDEDWLSVDFGTIFQQLQSGTKFDIVVAAVTGYAPEGSPASETVAERTALIDFTDPYYPSLQSLTVKTGSGVTSIDELPAGAKVAVQSATTGAFFAEANLPDAEIVEFNKAPGMYTALQGDTVEAVLNDLPVSLDAITDLPDLEVVEQLETGEEYAIAVAKDNPGLTEAINGALAEMIEDGTFQEIFLKYFPDQELPSYAQ